MSDIYDEKLEEESIEMSPYLLIQPGQYLTVKYLGKWEDIIDSFNNNKKRYSVELNGVEKSFDSGSSRVAATFARTKTGTLVRIEKAEGKQGRYSVTKEEDVVEGDDDFENGERTAPSEEQKDAPLPAEADGGNPF